jgi:hypothetical protein
MAGLTREAGPAGTVTHRVDAAASSGATSCTAGQDLAVQLPPLSAVVPAGHRIRVALAGHDASCFTRYGPAEETFTLELGSDSHLDLPARYG